METKLRLSGFGSTSLNWLATVVCMVPQSRVLELLLFLLPPQEQELRQTVRSVLSLPRPQNKPAGMVSTLLYRVQHPRRWPTRPGSHRVGRVRQRPQDRVGLLYPRRSYLPKGRLLQSPRRAQRTPPGVD